MAERGSQSLGATVYVPGMEKLQTKPDPSLKATSSRFCIRGPEGPRSFSEKHPHCGLRKRALAGAKALLIWLALSARLKLCPVTKPDESSFFRGLRGPNSLQESPFDLARNECHCFPPFPAKYAGKDGAPTQYFVVGSIVFTARIETAESLLAYSSLICVVR